MKKIEATKSQRDNKRVSESGENVSSTQLEETESSESDTMETESTTSMKIGSVFKKRDKVSDLTRKEPLTDFDDSGLKSLAKFSGRVDEESHENKWRKFWDHRREKLKHRSQENLATRRGSFEEVSSEVDAVSRKAMKTIRFDKSENYREFSNTEEYSLEKEKEKSEELPQNIEAPPRRIKSKLKNRIVLETVNADQNAIRKTSKTEENFATKYSCEIFKESDINEASKSKFFLSLNKKTFDYDIKEKFSTRKWSSLENLNSKLENDRKNSTERKIDGLLIERPARNKEKGTIASLKSSLERKIDSVEKILEDRVGKILEENVEKYPWLLPVESWIVDHSKPSGCSILQDERDNDTSRTSEGKSDQTFDFKFTVSSESGVEQGKIECGLDRLERFERVEPNSSNLVSRTKESDHSKTKNTCILKIKDPKHQDLFDKLKGNVKEKMEDIHRYFQRTNRLADANRRLKSQIWSSVVTIVLVEAKNLLPMDIDGLSDPYVKFRLGTEKYKSKVVHKTLNPVWLEQFDLHLYEDPYLGQDLEVTVWDRDKSHQDDLMGRAVINLAILERETTHRLWRDLEDGSGSIFLLLTISGTTASETISDLSAHEETPREREQLYQRYCLRNSLQRVRDVGHLTVKVFRAQGLAAADLGGKSDPFCVLELVNSRLQTQTEYKTLAPNWQKIFTFNVKDINSVLEVTVYDEDRDHKVEFLGKVAIPLLKIRNGEKRWYALKDKKLRGRAKGNCPQLLLEMNVVWNVVRACIRTLNPKEKKYMEPEIKFKRQVFLRNVLRLKAIIIIVIDIGKYIQSCWEWENKMRSIIALVIFVLGCYYFEPYMFPGAALLILLKYYLFYGDGSGFNQWVSGQVAAITGTPLSHHSSSHYHDEIDEGPATPGDDDDDEDDKDKEEKKSLKERLQAIQEVTQTVQNSIGYIASLCERVKNLFNFTVPYLSYVAMILTILGVAVLYFVPLRYLILAWGVNKFFRKIIRPHSVPNNELLDLISRVPDDEELINYRELKPVPTADCEKGSSSPGSSNLTRREQRKRHKAA